MCVVSNLGDQFSKTWPLGGLMPQQSPATPYTQINWPQAIPEPYKGPTREQFEEFLELFRAAKKIDIYLGQPDCEMDGKLAVLREHARRLGLDPDAVLK